jgi:hypothetical protein
MSESHFFSILTFSAAAAAVYGLVLASRPIETKIRKDTSSSSSFSKTSSRLLTSFQGSSTPTTPSLNLVNDLKVASEAAREGDHSFNFQDCDVQVLENM